ncbi:uncharacterized protein [Spinacia oleracea]|uniref:Aminotransferase-like plant mobile domain-containing protein n=1 Tax=Spinacia oleracea TaxID=3562 RepID=A0ABM3RSQ7_SPIOL|nr:uncharacterized protein LOC130472188 [Spinacia oleracea]
MTLVEDMKAELYPGCTTYKRLEFIISLLHNKVSNKWTDKSFSMLLKSLHRAFNYDKHFPANAHQEKKYTRALGLDYVKIDACVNHCILYRKEFANEEKCPKCLAPIWKEKVVHGGDEYSDDEDVDVQKATRVPQLILRHFPLVPRLQRMFISSKLARHMRWHKVDNKDDGIMRHPADLEAWKSSDTTFPDFAKDARNVRLGLASDGFNPGANMSSRYSIWPVMLVPYNLPPWMFMKNELNELWESGVKAFDAHAKETFNMRVVLLWTINDFPAYANLWLPEDHKWRLNKRSFGGKVQRGPPPDHLTGHDVMEQLTGYSNVEFGKDVSGKRKRGEIYIVHQWKKLSIFYQLPYSRHLLVRHNFDVMHVEKNVCESILGTILDLTGKNKDSLNAQLDLADMKMHDKLRAKSLGNNKWQVPPAPYNLTLNEKRKIVTLLSKLAFPDAYSSNISRCASLQDGKVMGMKTHYHHVFMQDLLMPAFKGVLDENVLEPLQELSLFFKQLCSKTLKVDDLKQMEKI